MRKVSVRLLPFLFVLYVFNFLDRTILSILAGPIIKDLKLSDTVLQRTFEIKQTLHGPLLGLGLYF